MLLTTADTAIFYSTMIMGVIGLVTNLTLFFMIIHQKKLREQDYMRFIINRTLIDVAYSLQGAILQPIGILFWSDSNTWCAAAGGVEIILICASIFNEPFLAANRYVSLLRREVYGNLFTKFRITLMCTIAWVLGIVSIVPHLICDSLGRVPGFLCCLRYKKEDLVLTLSINYAMIFVSYAVIMYCYYKMFVHIKHHQQQMMTNSQRSRLQEDREMLAFIAVTAVFPLATQSSPLIAGFLQMFAPDTISPMGMFGCNFVVLFCPVVNPMISVMIVRPVRDEFVRIIRRIRGKSDTVPF